MSNLKMLKEMYPRPISPSDKIKTPEKLTFNHSQAIQTPKSEVDNIINDLLKPTPETEFATPEKTKEVSAKQKNPPKPKPNDYVIELAEKNDVFLDQNKMVWVTVPKKDYLIDVPVRSKEFKAHLRRETRKACGKSPSKYAVEEAIEVAEDVAIEKGKSFQVHTRFFQCGNKVVIDLCQDNDLVIEIQNGNWRVIRKGNYKFHRTDEMLPLPTPSSNGNFFDLFKVLSIVRHEYKIMITTWTVTSVLTEIQRPLLLMHGPKGSAKSSTAQILQRIIDPLNHGGLYLNDKDDDISLTLEQYSMPFFDNLTQVKKSGSNILCQAVTNGARAKRKNYDDKKLIVTRYPKKPIIITAINCPYAASDLLDRTIPIEYFPLNQKTRKVQSQVDQQFDELHPSILGGLCDILAEALVKENAIVENSDYRLMDWARYGLAISDVVGSQENFSRSNFTWALAVMKQSVLTLEFGDDPFNQHLMNFLEEKKCSRLGTYSELGQKVYDEFTAWANANNVKDKLPGNASALSRKVNEIVDFLEINNWSTVAWTDRDGSHRTFTKVI